jgi:hypothetical protein
MRSDETRRDETRRDESNATSSVAHVATHLFICLKCRPFKLVKPCLDERQRLAVRLCALLISVLGSAASRMRLCVSVSVRVCVRVKECAVVLA